MDQPVYPQGPHVRPAQPGDIGAIAAFEVEIARISFPEDPVDDPAVHTRKLAKAMEKEPQGMFVLEAGGQVVGWLWITLNTNFLTNERYATFRSFAIGEAWRGTPAPQAFFSFGLDYCRKVGVKRATGKVHVSNIGMRALYKDAGFEPKHLTMEIDLSGED